MSAVKPRKRPFTELLGKYEKAVFRRGAGVADRAGLENRCGGNITEGSNPSLSAFCEKLVPQPLWPVNWLKLTDCGLPGNFVGYWWQRRWDGNTLPEDDYLLNAKIKERARREIIVRRLANTRPGRFSVYIDLSRHNYDSY
jgi:hypothetical protein